MAVAALLLVPCLGLLVPWLSSQPLPTSFGWQGKLLSAYVFAGIPAMMAFAGIGARLAEPSPHRSAMRVLLAGSLKGAVIGLGLALLVAIPIGALSQEVSGWLPLLLAGALVSGGAGALTSLWVLRGLPSDSRSREA